MSFELSARAVERLRTSGAIVSSRELTVSGDSPAWVEAVSDNGVWRAFAFTFENGREDHVLMRVDKDKETTSLRAILQGIWSVINEDCIAECAKVRDEAVTSALLWTILNRTESAVLILNARGRLLSSNQAGKEEMTTGSVLRNVSGTLRCVNESESKAFYHAVRECATAAEGQQEMIVFLENAARHTRIPVSLMRFQSGAHPDPLIVAMLPRQPDTKRVEMLAAMRGLTPAEARVAALMQLGLTNRDAAEIAGLKEQTFNTYAKRVLSKLNVTCRAEMVHMLTWQATLGRAS